MNNSNAPPAQGLPSSSTLPLQPQQQQQQHHSQPQQSLLLQNQLPLQHSYASRLISQQPQHQQQQQQSQQHPLPHPPATHILPSNNAHFAQPLPSNHNTVQYSSSYTSGSPAVLQHPNDPGFFNAHPSPYSTNSAAGSYTSSGEPNEAMAQAALSRQQYPPIASYHTPQSNSPASMHSPQHDASGRVYGVPSMSQPMYYSHAYSTMHQPTQYTHHTAASNHTQHHLPSATTIGLHYSPQHQQHQQHLPPPYQQPSQHTPHQQHSIIDAKSTQSSLQRSVPALAHPPLSSQQTSALPQQPPTPLQSQPPQSQSAPNQTAPNMPEMTALGSSTEPVQPAAPGPIPATTPQVVRQDGNGVQWIAFDYSRDRIKMQYTIRCDVESVDQNTLTDQFKTANCVYPRACEPQEKYKGNRRQYETECNSVGWALATLNSCLREKRGLIQRAVDSWRNSNRDVRLRSRRVRRQNKINDRKNRETLGVTGYAVDPHSNAASVMMHPQHPGLPSNANTSGVGLPPHALPPQMHNSTAGSDPRGNVGASGLQYNNTPVSQVPSHGLPSPSSLRNTQTFYTPYAQVQPVHSSTMPSIRDSMNPITQGAPPPALATPIQMSSSRFRDRGDHHMSDTNDDDEDDVGNGRALYGDIPVEKRRKFILVNDTQRGEHVRVRVRVALDSVNMDDIPDGQLLASATFPRSYYPRQMRSSPGSPRSRSAWDDDEDGLKPEQRGRTLVPVTMLDGSSDRLPAPKITRARRREQVMLNRLGYCMSWCQPRIFDGRKLFLQQSLDAYRGKVQSMLKSVPPQADDDDNAPTHFEVRPGKRKFKEYQDQRRRNLRGS